MATIAKINKPKQIENNLFCFHWVGGGGNSFRPLAKTLEPHGIQVFSVTLPGRYPTQIHLLMKSVREVVDNIQTQFLASIDNWEINKYPLFFFGHSYGGIVAYELAKKLKTVQLKKIIISAVKSPALLTEINKSSSTCYYHKYDDTKLIEHIKNIGGMPTGLDLEFLKVMLPTIRGDYEAFETYNQDDFGSTKLSCPIVGFSGIDDRVVDNSSMLSWQDCTTASFSIVEFPGTHFYISEPISIKLFEQEIIKNINSI